MKNFDPKRPLAAHEQALIRRAREKAFLLYEGRVTPHRSCGVCLAETFGVAWQPYQALRRGGLNGEGHCGAIRAGEMILGQWLGPKNPEDPVSDLLRQVMAYYQSRWKEKQRNAGWSDTICNTLTEPLGDFKGPTRMSFCTNMAADAAELVAESLARAGENFLIEPVKTGENR